MDQVLTVIRTFDNPIEANIVKEKLRSEGIPAFLGDENIVSLNPLYAIATGGIKLLVPNTFSASADNLLRLSEKEYKKSLICEACYGKEVEFQLSRKDKRNFFALLISFVFTIFPFYQKKVYRCDRCGYETDFIE